MNQKILIIDDEPDVIDMVEMNLKAAGFKICSAEDGESGLKKAREEQPTMVILDLMLPKMSGLEVCKALKKDAATSHIPVIMLTAKSDEVDRIVGLELGADDYVPKPFSPRELGLRVKSVLRRTQTVDHKQERLQLGDLVVDMARHEVFVRGKEVSLTATEFRLLAVLMERRGRVQSRDRLLNDVWGYESVIDTRTVDTHVRRLREKLGVLADYVETIRGVGYRMSESAK
ncbi:MAG: response regulator transcription factor [Bdellovibrionaceae bacterium]|nr:response regulator transcription factor [Pseudobdellovibrionaceae bacterium]